MRIFRTSATVFLLITSIFSLNAISFGDGPATSPEKEKELIAKLQSNSPDAEKAIACKQLAIYGSSAAVPELEKLLPNPQLSSWSRIALEAIPGPEADAALRKASESLEGRLLVGMINSLGVRRDANAVAILNPRLQDKDIEVASAAAVALGRIGNEEASKSLRQALASSTGAVRSAVAEGCVLCAERFHISGNTAEAIALYDQVRGADVPAQRIIEATRGAILARGKDGIPILTELFHSKDKGLFQLALGVTREFPGSDLDQALAAELSKTEPARAALILQAMADRKDTVVVAAILKASEAGPMPVRLSAVNALARVGNASCLPSLLKIAIDADSELAQAARTTLAELSGEQVDSQIVALLDGAQGKTYPLLLELIGKRRIEAVAALLKAVENDDKLVRTAALQAMGETVSLKDLNVLITQAVAPRHAEDVEVARQALKTASIRMADREACAAELSAAINKAKSADIKGKLLQILGAMGGPKALATIAAAAKGPEASLQDVSSRLLGEWMTEDAAPVLLDLAKSNSNPYQVRAIRGYIRIARQFVLPEDQRMVMCQNAFDAARQTAEKKLVLDVLERYPTMEGIKMATKAMKTPELKDEATQTTLIIAQKLGGKGVDVKELLTSAGIEKMKVEIVKAEYGAGATQKDVTEVLKKKVTDLPIVTLDSTSYNASFGGDPLPGSVKKLKVKYRIDGKAGEAAFAEDSLIILPMPK
jgi:HEAT repeat protein